MKKYSKILLAVVLSILIFSCKSSKTSCDAYGDTFTLRKDSILVRINHQHVRNEQYCYYEIDTTLLTK